MKSAISFDQFAVDPIKRTLAKNGDFINLNPKTFDLLLALIERHGEVISKDELLDMVWGEQFVEENNLTVNVSLLRKALGEKKGNRKYIVTVPGNGYSFVADINFNGDSDIETHRVNGYSFGRMPAETFEKEKRKAKRPIESLRGWFSIFGILTILIIGGGSFWFYTISKNNPVDRKTSGNLTIQTYVTEELPRRVCISPSGKLLAYIVSKEGLATIWVSNVSNGNNRQITETGNFNVFQISFNPDEDFIYFIGRQGSDQEWSLNRISIFGGAVQEIIKDVHSQITFSPDGRQIAFLRRENEPGATALVIADAETGENEKILLNFNSPQTFAMIGISWAPDGKNIAAFISDEEGRNYALTLIDVATAARNKIGHRFWDKNANVVWERDGEGLIIINPEKTGHDGISQIWKVSYPDGTEQKLTDDVNNYNPNSLGISDDNKIITYLYRVDPEIWISPTVDNPLDDEKVISSIKTRSAGLHGIALANDGKVIFTSSLGNSQTIWEMDTDGLNQKQLTPTKENSSDGHFVLTNDNRYLIFQSDRSGESEIWRANRDGSGLKQITKDGGNDEPTVTPDGKWIIYTNYEDGLPRLWRVSIDGGEAEQISEDLASWPMVSPDGKYIAASYGFLKWVYIPKIAIFPIAGGKPLKILPAPGSALYNRLRWLPGGKTVVYKDTKQGLWRHDINSGNREKLDLKEGFRVGQFAWSTDGKQFIYAGGVLVHEIVILENFNNTGRGG